jgi:hypothetical protein
MRKILLSIACLAALAAPAKAADNYAATAGAGLTFGAKDAAGVLYTRFIGCDNTTVSQCWNVNASGQLVVSVANTNANGQATMANSSPVTIASNQTANALWGHGATGSAVPANATYNGVLDAAGGTNMLGLAGDPCQTSVKTTVPITLATAAVKVIVTGVSAKKIYVCQIHLTNNAADSVAVFEATTATTCATSPVAVVGAGTTVATAATGYNFAANGGISLGTGSNQVLQTATNANDLCIAQSAATQLTGSVTYVTR